MTEFRFCIKCQEIKTVIVDHFVFKPMCFSCEGLDLRFLTNEERIKLGIIADTNKKEK